MKERRRRKKEARGSGKKQMFPRPCFIFFPFFNNNVATMGVVNNC